MSLFLLLRKYKSSQKMEKISKVNFSLYSTGLPPVSRLGGSVSRLDRDDQRYFSKFSDSEKHDSFLFPLLISRFDICFSPHFLVFLSILSLSFLLKKLYNFCVNRTTRFGPYYRNAKLSHYRCVYRGAREKTNDR